MHEDYGKMAGGHNVRPEPWDRWRFRVMHKIYEFEKRFGKGKMCVGCGRCDAACPKDISLKKTLGQLALALDKEGTI
jgi:anaerobic sulfite reductase subunit A